MVEYLSNMHKVLGSIPNTGRKCGSDQSFHNLQKQWEIILFTGCEFKQTLPEGGS